MINPGVFDTSLVFHVITDVRDGNMSYLHGDEATVTANRMRLLETLNIAPDRVLPFLLTHEDKIFVAEEDSLGPSLFSHDTMITGYDACITDQKNVFIYMMFADCIPLALFDTDSEAIGLVHLGRDSNTLKLGPKAIRRMHDKYGTKPENLIAHIGPAIHKESYLRPKSWFQPELLEAWESWGEFLIETESGDIAIDNVGYATAQLLEAGIKPEHLYVAPEDTFVSHEYFSHNRAKTDPEANGRFAIILGSLL